MPTRGRGLGNDQRKRILRELHQRAPIRPCRHKNFPRNLGRLTFRSPDRLPFTDDPSRLLQIRRRQRWRCSTSRAAYHDEQAAHKLCHLPFAICHRSLHHTSLLSLCSCAVLVSAGQRAEMLKDRPIGTRSNQFDTSSKLNTNQLSFDDSIEARGIVRALRVYDQQDSVGQHDAVRQRRPIDQVRADLRFDVRQVAGQQGAAIRVA